MPEINQWDVSNKERFAINNLTKNEISYIFQESFEILKDFKLSKEAVGFRAGGLYVQPFSKLKPFFEKYNIHYFAVGAEYENVAPGKVDYYALPRKLGMCKFTARTQGISTSTLIRRIVNRADEFLSSPKRQTPKKL